ncbi:MAG TPA: VanW family protein [Clostridia bacterium]|nr:VanW family protein [Clostridia bacterium]
METRTRVKKKNIWGKVFLITIIALLMIGIAGITTQAYQILNIETFYEGVEVDGITLDSMTKEEALDKIREHNQPDLDKMKIVLTHGEKKWEYDYHDINAQIDIEEIVEKAYSLGREGTIVERLKGIYELSKEPKKFETTLTYDVSLISKDIENISKEINEESIEATIEFQPGEEEKFTFTPEKIGKGMLADKAVEEIIARVDAGDFSVYEIPTQQLDPKYTLDELNTWTSRIAYYSTPLTNNANRNHNIRLSSGAYYNVRLDPGEEYSMNDATGPRGAKEGYKSAAVIKQGKKFEDEPGGGNCQTSTTLYGAVLRADLEIVNRLPHSIISTYTAVGTDATVNYPWADFQFKNNKDTPVFITRYISGGRLHVEIYGKPSDEYDEVKVVSQETGRSDTPAYKIVEDPTMLEGTEIVDWKSRPKVTAVSYRVYYKDGKEVKRIKEANSTYPRIVGQKTVGTKKKEVEEPKDEKPKNEEAEVEKPKNEEPENPPVED